MAKIIGTNGSDDLHGTSGDDLILGLGSNDRLFGGGGNDVLDGRAGADTMTGGTGNDSYYVDNPGDLVIEKANEGTDTVFASISYTLPANVENLTLLDVVDAFLIGTGNSLDNVIIGN